MRLVCTFGPQEQQENLNPYAFSHYLTSQGIENECEEVIVPEEMPLYRIWVKEEELVHKAIGLFASYRAHPEKIALPVQEEEEKPALKTRQNALSPSPFAPLTVLIILVCVLTFLWGQVRDGIGVPPAIPGVVEAPVLKSINRDFAFDYPHYFELRDQLLAVYPKEVLDNKQTPPPKAQALLQEMERTPFWNGFYDRFVAHYHDKTIPLAYHGPFFEKIGQGEAWRLWTPALLHYNFFHIFFNLLWFIMLGNQIEWRIGKGRYFLLMALVALISNVAQYLMSGSFFMGLSGVIMGLAGFVWARQQKAPWEGYLFQKTTLIFLGIFIFGIFALQVVFFIFQLFGDAKISLPIANTAHLVGAFVGYILGRTPLFALQRKRD